MKQLIGFMLLVGLVLVYWKVVVCIVVIILAIKAAPVAWREWQDTVAEKRARRDALVARADIQHAWAMAGDPRGTFGAYPPAI